MQIIEHFFCICIRNLKTYCKLKIGDFFSLLVADAIANITWRLFGTLDRELTVKGIHCCGCWILFAIISRRQTHGRGFLSDDWESMRKY